MTIVYLQVEKRKRVVKNTPMRFEIHVQFIMKENTIRNNIRRWTTIFNNKKSFHALSKMYGNYNIMARSLYALAAF